MPLNDHLPPGRVVGARYEILAPLGKGGMGMVYKARDRMLEETVALKVLRPEVAASPDMARRFRAEIKLARSVSHKNVCRIHEYGEDGPLRYISMAFVDGVELRQVLRERGPLPPEQAFDVCIQVAEGLEAIHDEGIVHRDLKSTNLMMDARGVVRLMDFGIAKHWEAEPAAAMTAMGQLVGTPHYMSPEHIRGDKLDGRSDLYALGIVAYELFTGETPFHADTPMGVLIKHLNEPPPLDGSVERLPAPLLPVLRRALAKQRDERFATALEMAQALRQAKAAFLRAGAPAGPTVIVPMPASSPPRVALPTTVVPPVTAAPGSLEVARPAEPPPRSRRVVVLAAAAAVVLVALGTAGVWLLRPTARPSEEKGGAPPVPASPVPAVVTGGSVPVPATPVTVPSPPPVAFTAAPPAEFRAAPSKPPRASRSEEVTALLSEAEAAFALQQHEAALSFYEQVLRLDPGNERARIGKELCVQAAARATERPPARAFAAGATRREEAPAPGPVGFEDSAGIAVRRVAQAAPPPGKIFFQAEPSAVAPPDPYSVQVFLVNESHRPLVLREVIVTTTVNGRSVSGPVAPAAREVPPQQRALLLSMADRWKTETTDWSMAVAVRLANGETLRNELVWK